MVENSAEKIKVSNIFQDKKAQRYIVIALLIMIIILGSWIRLLNLPLLKDVTTNKHIPLALDPFYFLRLAKTKLAGGLPAYDTMRYNAVKTGFSTEILPSVVVAMYKFMGTFNKNITIEYVDVISPVVLFAFGLIAFFFLILLLTKSKTTAILSCAFLSIIPSYLYRTMAGFSDHESIGILSFFLAMLILAISLILIERKSKKIRLRHIPLLGIASGFTAFLTIVSWGGISNFVFMILPGSILIFWIANAKSGKSKESQLTLKKILLFYITFIIFTILFSLLYGLGMDSIISRVFLNTSSILTGLTLLFLASDYTLLNNTEKIKFIDAEKIKKFRAFISLLITFVFGLIIFSILGKNIIGLLLNLKDSILHPFGTGRVGLTVAENAQPFLVDWIGQTGKIFFWAFFLGMIFVSIELAKGVHGKKQKILFITAWILMVCGILFSRISSSSILNGTNFLSQFTYFVGLLIFLGYAVKLYIDEKINLNSRSIIISVWLFFMLISARSAIRFFFAITPFVSFMVAFFAVQLFKYSKNTKEDLNKMVLRVGTVIAICLLTFSFFSFLTIARAQAKGTGPSANYQWQKAMQWARENTPEGSIFVHWWDYGYWVQYLGERSTVTDGGHAVGYWDHLIGRYVLTTPNSETALSFMKTHNVSYLLIDQTDIGKYTAYSSIGNDEEKSDRYAWIPSMISQQKDIQETSEGMKRIYQGAFAIDEDIIYNENMSQIFLPAQKTAMLGFEIEISVFNGSSALKQPIGIFLYNGKQFRIPIRYAYYANQYFDFKKGLESTISIIPHVYTSNTGLQIDRMGASIYMSPRVSKGLFARLYLLNNTENLDGFKLDHSEEDPIIANLNSQGANLNEITYYQGIRGPIKIWKIEYPENIIPRKEFTQITGGYGEFDELKFTSN